MDRDDLIRALDDAEVTELATLAQAVETNKQNVLSDPCKRNLDALEKAQQMLAAFQARKQPQGGAAVDQGPAFAALYSTKKEVETVLSWLHAQGWKVKKTKLYDAKAQGKLIPREDGLFHALDVERWAVAQGLPKTAPDQSEEDSDESARLTQEKLREKVEGERLENELRRIRVAEKRGELLTVQEYNDDFAAAASILRESLLQFCEVQVRELIYLCEGDPRKEEQVKEFMLDKARGWLHGFSQVKDYPVPEEGHAPIEQP